MQTVQFVRAHIPTESKQLVRFDRKVFQGDAFPEEMWRGMEAWWMLLGRRKIGCCAFQLHSDFKRDLNSADNPVRRGSLLIQSTGILPAARGCGFGTLLKVWQLSYARSGKYKRVVTNCRKSNQAIIHLNRKFGFRKIMTVPDYYADPPEPAIVFELVLH